MTKKKSQPIKNQTKKNQNQKINRKKLQVVNQILNKDLILLELRNRENRMIKIRL